VTTKPTRSARPASRPASREVSRAAILADPDAHVSQADSPESWRAFQRGLIVPAVKPPTATPGGVPADPASPTDPTAMPPPGLAAFYYTVEGRAAYWAIPPKFRPQPGGYAAGVDVDHPPPPDKLAPTHVPAPAGRVGAPQPPPAAHVTAAGWVPLFLSWVGRYRSRRAWCESLDVPYLTTYNWTRPERMCLPSARVVGKLLDRALAAQAGQGTNADRLTPDELQTLMRLHVMPQQKKGGTGATADAGPGPVPVRRSRMEAYGEGTAVVLPAAAEGTDRRVPLPRPSTSKYIPSVTPLIMVECMRAVTAMIVDHGSAYAAGLALGMRAEILSAFVSGRSIPGRPAFMALTTWAYQRGEKYARYVQPLSVMARARRKRGEIKAVWERAQKVWAKVEKEEGL
jgi:hypothetical protein